MTIRKGHQEHAAKSSIWLTLHAHYLVGFLLWPLVHVSGELTYQCTIVIWAKTTHEVFIKRNESNESIMLVCPLKQTHLISYSVCILWLTQRSTNRSHFPPRREEISFTMAAAAAASIPSAEESVGPPLPSIEWLQTIELGYENKSPPQKQVCFQCGKEAEKLSKCAKCQVASYCSKECQVQNWKHGVGHKHSCKSK